MSASAASNNSEQVAYWNDAAGLTWARLQRVLDRQIDPLGREAIRVLAPCSGERILDVGCGCGQTSIELAEQVAPSGSVVAVDISRPMLEVARARLAGSPNLPLEFRESDAQTEPLGEAVFDAAYSRFGVMFFSDPVAAFANVRRALKPDGRLAFVCWRPLAENAWMRVPLEAARPWLPPAAPPDPAAPGPFAFADPERVRRILDGAGFADPQIERFDTQIGGTGLDDALTIACRIGPLGSILRECPERLADVGSAVREALALHLRDGAVWMSAAAWIVRARRGPDRR